MMMRRIPALFCLGICSCGTLTAPLTQESMIQTYYDNSYILEAAAEYLRSNDLDWSTVTIQGSWILIYPTNELAEITPFSDVFSMKPVAPKLIFVGDALPRKIDFNFYEPSAGDHNWRIEFDSSSSEMESFGTLRYVGSCTQAGDMKSLVESSDTLQRAACSLDKNRHLVYYAAEWASE